MLGIRRFHRIWLGTASRWAIHAAARSIEWDFDFRRSLAFDRELSRLLAASTEPTGTTLH